MADSPRRAKALLFLRIRDLPIITGLLRSTILTPARKAFALAPAARCSFHVVNQAKPQVWARRVDKTKGSVGPR